MILHAEAVFPCDKLQVCKHAYLFLTRLLDLDASNYNMLTKASLMIQNKFNLKKFQANSVFIVTYDRVMPVNTNKVKF
jgi:hypothetical protein